MDHEYYIVNLTNNLMIKNPILNLNKYLNKDIIAYFDLSIQLHNWNSNDNIVALSDTSYEISYHDLLIIINWLN